MTYNLLTLAGLGDSLTYATTSSSKTQRSSTSHMAYAEMYSPGLLLAPPSMNFGVSGETIAQIAARTGTVRAAGPNLCAILAGMNNLTGAGTGQTAAQLAAAILAIAADLKNGSPSVEPIIVTLPKATAINAANDTKRRAMNQILRSQTRYRVADAALIADTMGLPNFDVISWSYDGTHFNPEVYEIIGQAIAGAVEDMRDTFPADLGTNPFTNGAMTGSGGSVAGTGSGSVATGWLCSNLNAEGNRFTGRVEVGTDPRVETDGFVTLASLGYAVGDTIIADFDVKITSRKVHQIYVYMLFDDGVGTVGTGEFAYNRHAGTVRPLPVLAGTMRIGPVVIPATTTRIKLAIYVQAPTAGLGAGFVDILLERVAIRKA